LDFAKSTSLLFLLHTAFQSLKETGELRRCSGLPPATFLTPLIVQGVSIAGVDSAHSIQCQEAYVEFAEDGCAGVCCAAGRADCGTDARHWHRAAFAAGADRVGVGDGAPGDGRRLSRGDEAVLERHRGGADLRRDGVSRKLKVALRRGGVVDDTQPGGDGRSRGGNKPGHRQMGPERSAGELGGDSRTLASVPPAENRVGNCGVSVRDGGVGEGTSGLGS
jgi:hypothetical protein